MSDVGLMFVGAVLFVNGLLLLGKVDAKGATTFNLFVGALQTAIPFYLIATATNTSDILLDSGIFLFGFTYLYVGISNLAGQEPRGLGWYSAWVAIMAAAFGITHIVQFDDRPAVAAVVGAVGAVLAGARAWHQPAHRGHRLADADPVVHDLHHPRLRAAAGGVGPRSHVAGAGRHRGRRDRAGTSRNPEPPQASSRTRPGRGRGTGLGVLTHS